MKLNGWRRVRSGERHRPQRIRWPMV